MSVQIVLSEATFARIMKAVQQVESEPKTNQVAGFAGKQVRGGGGTGTLSAPQYPGMVWIGGVANKAVWAYLFGIDVPL